eukprot:TRINITY_DN38701_c0_g1_i1.p1 TRINITY_DN38701_c0_g1~~TRINITY_DN38701_c0_g1_i1.p1  ORF type:complete len:107 (-),score=14.50 TRINITY_DN38701_c0_g1_i1:29-349(-)
MVKAVDDGDFKAVLDLYSQAKQEAELSPRICNNMLSLQPAPEDGIYEEMAALSDDVIQSLRGQGEDLRESTNSLAIRHQMNVGNQMNLERAKRIMEEVISQPDLTV